MEEREYFQMVQQSTDKVSYSWKVYHVITLMTGAVSGLVTEVYFCRILNGFSNNCVLSAKISFRTSHKHIPPNNTAISTTGTRWSSDNLCQFCSVMWITSFLVGIVLSVFFLACAKGGRGYENYPFYRPWKLICPVFFISVVMLVNMATATALTFSGFKKFCAEFEPKLKTKKCSSALDMFTIDFPNRKHTIVSSINVVNNAAILTLFAWCLFTLLTLLRICFAPDFSLLVITVKKVNPKKTWENTDA